MNHFTLQYHYAHQPTGAIAQGGGCFIHVNFGLGQDASKALFAAERVAREAEIACNLRTAHEYSFPDGSLFHSCLTTLGKEELQSLISSKLRDGVTVEVKEHSSRCWRCSEPAVIDSDTSSLRCSSDPTHVLFFKVHWEGLQVAPGAFEPKGNRKERRKQKALARLTPR